MDCPGCKAPLKTDVKFCTACGTPVPATETKPLAVSGLATPPPDVTASTSATAPACEQCGAGLEHDDKFCLNCGGPVVVHGTTAGGPPERVTPKRFPTAAILAGILVVVLAVAIIALVTNNGTSSSGTKKINRSDQGFDTAPRTSTTLSSTLPTSMPPTAPATLPLDTGGVPPEAVAIANELASALGSHNWAAVRALEPSKGDWTDAKFDLLDHDLLHDTFISLRSTDFGTGWTQVEGGLVANETARTRFYCAKWQINVDLHQIDETGPTTLIEDLPAGVSAQDLDPRVRSTC